MADDRVLPYSTLARRVQLAATTLLSYVARNFAQRVAQGVRENGRRNRPSSAHDRCHLIIITWHEHSNLNLGSQASAVPVLIRK